MRDWPLIINRIVASIWLCFYLYIFYNLREISPNSYDYIDMTAYSGYLFINFLPLAGIICLSLPKTVPYIYSLLADIFSPLSKTTSKPIFERGFYYLIGYLILIISLLIYSPILHDFLIYYNLIK